MEGVLSRILDRLVLMGQTTLLSIDTLLTLGHTLHYTPYNMRSALLLFFFF